MIISMVNPHEDRNRTIFQDPVIHVWGIYLKDSSSYHKDMNLLKYVHYFSIHDIKILERT